MDKKDLTLYIIRELPAPGGAMLIYCTIGFDGSLEGSQIVDRAVPSGSSIQTLAAELGLSGTLLELSDDVYRVLCTFISTFRDSGLNLREYLTTIGILPNEEG